MNQLHNGKKDMEKGYCGIFRIQMTGVKECTISGKYRQDISQYFYLSPFHKVIQI